MKKQIRRMKRHIRKWLVENKEGVQGVAVIAGLFISAYAIAITLTLAL